MSNNRREFIKTSAKATAGVYAASLGFSAKSYANIIGANNRVRVGAIGFSDRFRQALFPSFNNHYKELNFDIVAVSDLWKKRRDEGTSFLKDSQTGVKFATSLRTFANRLFNCRICSWARPTWLAA